MKGCPPQQLAYAALAESDVEQGKLPSASCVAGLLLHHLVQIPRSFGAGCLCVHIGMFCRHSCKPGCQALLSQQAAKGSHQAAFTGWQHSTCICGGGLSSMLVTEAGAVAGLWPLCKHAAARLHRLIASQGNSQHARSCLYALVCWTVLLHHLG